MSGCPWKRKNSIAYVLGIGAMSFGGISLLVGVPVTAVAFHDDSRGGQVIGLTLLISGAAHIAAGAVLSLYGREKVVDTESEARRPSLLVGPSEVGMRWRF